VLMLPDSEPMLSQFQREMSEWLGMDAAEIKRLLGVITEASSELKTLFKLNIGAMPDIKAILAKAEEQVTAHHADVARQTNELQQSIAQLTDQVNSDPLTKLMNRRGFDEQLNRVFAECQGNGQSLSLIFGDIDRFKPINDTHHHVAGDSVMMQGAQRLSAVVGSGGIVCRYGGEEFAILLAGVDRVQANRLAEDLRRCIERDHMILGSGHEDDQTIAVTMSFGVATLDVITRAALTNPDVLIRVADQAMYAAKTAGRNCVRLPPEIDRVDHPRQV